MNRHTHGNQARTLRVLVGCIFALAGCDGTDSGTIVGPLPDTYQIACTCDGMVSTVSGTYQTTRYEVTNECLNAPPTQLEADAACAGLGSRISGWYDSSKADYSCKATPGTVALLIATKNCVPTPSVTGPNGKAKSLARGGVASDNDLSIAWPNSAADHVGELVSASAHLQVKFAKWRGAHPVPHGMVYLTNGLCGLGQSCELVLDGLDLRLDDFSINRPWPARDIDFRGATITNLRRWVGVKYADGSFEFPTAMLKIAGRVEGKDKVMVVQSPEPIRGQLLTASDGTKVLTIDARLDQTHTKLDLSMAFRLDR